VNLDVVSEYRAEAAHGNIVELSPVTFLSAVPITDNAVTSVLWRLWLVAWRAADAATRSRHDTVQAANSGAAKPLQPHHVTPFCLCLLPLFSDHSLLCQLLPACDIP
jgi:hypothetical protein